MRGLTLDGDPRAAVIKSLHGAATRASPRSKDYGGLPESSSPVHIPDGERLAMTGHEPGEE